MSSIRQVDITEAGINWYVGSSNIPAGYRSGRAEVIIPVETIDGLTDAEIAHYVRECAVFAAQLRGEEEQEEDEWMLRRIQEDEERRAKKKLGIVTTVERQRKPGYLYLIKGLGTPWYKIGISKCLGSRVKQLGTKAPFEIEVIKAHQVSDMEQAEVYWHNLFGDKRTGGEWFALSSEDTQEFIEWSEAL